MCRKGIQQALALCPKLKGTNGVWLCTPSRRALFTPGWKLPSWAEWRLSPYRPAALWGFHPSWDWPNSMSLKAVLCEVWGFLKQQSEKKKNPSKMPNQKEIKSYKQELLSFAQFSFIIAEATRGNLAAAGWHARGAARHPWLCDRSVETTMSITFSWVPAVILLRQTGLLPFHAQFAHLFFQSGELVFCATCFPVINVYHRYMLSCATFLFPSIFRFYISVNILPPPAKELFL